MRRVHELMPLLILSFTTVLAASSFGQDWPQWRGPNREARASGFEVPATWPEQLNEKWSVTVGEGVASPSLVGDKLYVFARLDGNEILRCLNAATGDEIWKDEYAAEAIRGPASGFDGPRASPTVEDGKVVTLGAQGMVSCFDAATGELKWRNDDNVGNVPRFATSSSPIVLAGLAITEFGEDRDGGLVAYDLETGDEKWTWTGSGAAYGSPVAMNIDGVEAVVAPMSDKMVAVAAADGAVLWEMPYRQGRYNSASPIVNDDMLIMAGPTSGLTALALAKEGQSIDSDQAWKNTDNSVGYNTPVVKDGKLYGISSLNSLFCINVADGQTAWNAPLGTEGEATTGQRGGREEGARDGRGDDSERAEEGQDQGQRRRGRRGRRGGGGRGGYGSVVDAGSAIFALVPSGQLTVFAPGDEYSPVASYKVAEEGTYAYPVPTRFGLFVKDKDSVKLLTAQ